MHKGKVCGAMKNAHAHMTHTVHTRTHTLAAVLRPVTSLLNYAHTRTHDTQHTQYSDLVMSLY